MGVCKWTLAIPIVLIAVISYKFNAVLTPKPLPTLNNTWWGSRSEKDQDTSIREFKIELSKEVLDDLQYRLDHHRRFAEPLEGIYNQYGINTKLLKSVVTFWQKDYKWAERQKYLNQYPQFITNIQGLDIHFIRVKPEKTKKKVLPLLLLHGWPGSVREFYEIIPLLTTPREDKDFVFEVIIPSLPGFGFSEPAAKPGLGAAQIAVVFKNLMERLGFKQFYAQGGDLGAVILQNMAILFPESVLGLHSNMCFVVGPKAFLKTLIGAIYPPYIVKEGHESRVYPLLDHYKYLLSETGYFHIQATKPDTIGVGLNDSPVGLAAYILEKFIVGTNRDYLKTADGALKRHYSYSSLLDNIMFYWITRSATSSFRLYAETFNEAHYSLGITQHPVLVPTACARFENDFYSPDGVIKDQFRNLVQLTDHEGGHFAAFQLPFVLAEDIFAGIDKMLKLKQ